MQAIIIKNDIMWEVWVDNDVVWASRNQQEAVQWALDHGYPIDVVPANSQSVLA